MGCDLVRFCDLRRTLLGGYRREDVLHCYQKLMRQAQAERERLEQELEAGNTVIGELSEENETLLLRNKLLEEQVAGYERTSQRL